MAKNEKRLGIADSLFNDLTPISEFVSESTKINKKEETSKKEKLKKSIKPKTNTENSTLILTIEKKEKRSQRMNFLVQPSVAEKVKIICKEAGISVNELVNQFLEKVSESEL